jgi:hypothetical protein
VAYGPVGLRLDDHAGTQYQKEIEHPWIFAFAAPNADEVPQYVARGNSENPGSYIAWRDALVKRNKMRAGEKLTNDGGRHLRTHDGKVSVTDGPYSESREILGGFFMIEAADYGEAVEIARTCPHLGEGKWIEERQVDAVH